MAEQLFSAALFLGDGAVEGDELHQINTLNCHSEN